MINSKTAESDVQGTEDLQQKIRERLESQLDDINACGGTLDSIHLFLKSNSSEEHKELIKRLDDTLENLAYFYRVLSQTHAELNKSDDGEK